MEQYTYQTNNSSRTARWSLIIGIVIVLNMFFNYAVSLVYKEPKFEAYMVEPNAAAAITTRASCLSVGGQWSESVTPVEVVGKNGAKTTTSGYCDPDFTNRKNYDADHTVYQRNVFIVLIILGIAALVAGILMGHAILTPALAWGGVLSLLIASMRYWSVADNIFKVLILAAALSGLIWIAVKKFSK